MSSLSRRQLIGALAALGASPALLRAFQSETTVTPELLREAHRLLAAGLAGEDFARIAPAVQRNLDFFQLVRDLEIEDSVEPAVVFRADAFRNDEEER